MLRVATWNVNGLRSCASKGYLDWLAASGADVVCLQETKARPEQLDEEVRQPRGWQTWFASALKPGYSGTAAYCRVAPAGVRLGLGDPAFDGEGRTIELDLGAFVLVGSYYPNSQPGGKRLDYKLAYDEAVLARAQALRAAGREVALTGDFNAAHTEIDLANPKQNEENPGFLPEERAWVDRALAAGLRDVFRDRHPGETGHYTWWTFRTGARARNVGWRIDYFLCSPDLAERVRDVRIHAEVLGSDHCPVTLDLDV
jgi:exodeoxyribonuclease-3